MGKVQSIFDCGRPGAVSRSVDEIVISVRNASETEIPFGAPVFLASGGAVPFSLAEPQDFGSFLGFAVRVADKNGTETGALVPEGLPPSPVRNAPHDPPGWAHRHPAGQL